MEDKVINNLNLSKKLGVSHPTIGRWVDDAVEGKNNLQIVKHLNKYQVVENDHNTAELLRLKEKAVKYRSKSTFQTIPIHKEIYDLLNQSQLIELFHNLDKLHTIPLKFTHLGEGAHLWNKLSVLTPNDRLYVNQSKALLEDNLSYILAKISKFEVVHVIDIGGGNGDLNRILIQKCRENKLNIKYTSLSASSQQHGILNANLKKWYPDIEITKLKGDIEQDSLRDILFQSSIHNQKVCNLITGLDFFANNYLQSETFLKNLSSSMSKSDVLLYVNELDNITERTNFSVIQNQTCMPQTSWLAEKLGFRKEMYITENRYESDTNSQIQVLRLTTDLELVFRFNDFEKAIQFHDGDEIIVWRHYLYTLDWIIKIFSDANLQVQHLSTSMGKNQILSVAEIQ